MPRLWARPVILVHACLLMSCSGDDGEDRRLETFTSCVSDGGGSVVGDVEIVVDDNGQVLSAVGDVEADDALLDECLAAASD